MSNWKEDAIKNNTHNASVPAHGYIFTGLPHAHATLE
jgi:hypothetical protein